MINQPRNRREGNFSFNWNRGFSSIWDRRFIKAQKIIDSESLRYLDAFVPRYQGELIRSGIRNTELGSGRIRYQTPYAKRLYYNPQFNFRGKPKRGGYWFERMKRKHKAIILRRVGEYFGDSTRR